MQTAIVVNTNASTLRRHPDLPSRIEAIARGRAAVYRTRTLEELDAVSRSLCRAGTARVVLCGGDGTLMAGVTALSRASAGAALPELVLAPAGTVATVARNLGQRAKLLPTLRAVVGNAPGKLAERPTLAVAAAGEAERVGFIFGTGLVARFFDRYYAGGAGGYAAAAKIVARVFVGSFSDDAYARSVLSPMPCALEVDGRRLGPEAWSLVVCSVVRDLGLHLLVTHRAGEDPERPHLVASALPPRKLGPQASRVLLGKSLEGADGDNFDGLVRRFTLRFPEGPGAWVLDGDVFRSAEVSVCAGPRVRLRTY